jgi:hypothetical protein
MNKNFNFYYNKKTHAKSKLKNYILKTE